ncbi:Acyl-coenzyme A oxidase 3, peroxisomal [Porphyridium purpureum]|uniref:Acyl-coenzyme A oxidase n=1 Tax=Porphyridium purpureum TaxID=35688 RepID=A0A5J4YYF4_PORPP|nr:Acyl-coenzyme A oxidase 3, peroxisomal [Porphyridium purpureum]|eukprot:POR1612..scf209_3
MGIEADVAHAGAAAAAPKKAWDTRVMFRELMMHDVELREYVLNHVFGEELFKLAPQYGMTVRQERDLTMARWARMRELKVYDNVLAVGVDDPSGRRAAVQKYDCLSECVGLLDHSLEIKTGVHYGLFGSTIARLGSKHQRELYLPKVQTCEMLGCFALTELGHGSNARGIETTATYAPETDSIVLHTPTETAQKYWIGGAAEDACWTTAMAQLYVNGECHGVHAFIVRLRNDTDKQLCPGVWIEDCGHKCGLNGVDNGRIWFDNVHIPRSQMLSGVASIDDSGKYQSAIKNPDQRFAVQLGALSGGRISIAVNSTRNAALALTTAIRYAHSRRAFGPDGAAEVALMHYRSHQQRLLPYLARTYAMSFAVNELKRMWWDNCQLLGTPVSKDVHFVSSLFKALMTWNMRDSMQECRESCGGQGYASINRIGPVKNDRDVMMTFEGDNSVLLQRAGKMVMDDYARTVKSRKRSGCFKWLSEEFDTKVNSPARRTGSEDLSQDEQDLERLLETALHRRLYALLESLAQEVPKLQRELAGDAFEVANMISSDASELGYAFAELLIWQWFRRDVARISNAYPDMARVLQMLSSLYALDTVDRSPSFLRLSCISQAEASVVRHAKRRRCAELAPHSMDLVNSFGIPDHLLGPIAGDWELQNRRSKL